MIYEYFILLFNFMMVAHKYYLNNIYEQQNKNL